MILDEQRDAALKPPAVYRADAPMVTVEVIARMIHARERGTLAQAREKAKEQGK